MDAKNEVKRVSLWEITEEFEKLEEMIIEAGGEITEDQEELIAEIDLLLTTKTDGVVYYIEKQKDLIALADEKLKVLQEFKTARKKSIDNFSSYVVTCMERLEKPKIQGDFNKIAIRKPTQVVRIDDEKSIPMTFTKVIPATTSIDKAELKKALKRGEIINGAVLVDGKKSLTISKRVS